MIVRNFPVLMPSYENSFAVVYITYQCLCELQTERYNK